MIMLSFKDDDIEDPFGDEFDSPYPDTNKLEFSSDEGWSSGEEGIIRDFHFLCLFSFQFWNNIN